jgi:predicted SPOUT superfamily RNA methylase MTH1
MGALTEGERVTVRVSSRRPVRARLVDDPLPGLSVERMDLQAALGREDAGFRIATSRHGEALTVGRLASLAGRVEGDGATIAFGAPERGLPAILGFPEADVPAGGDEDATEPIGGFDLWLNSIPNQGSEVVRTEEAVFATLGLLTLTE